MEKIYEFKYNKYKIMNKMFIIYTLILAVYLRIGNVCLEKVFLEEFYYYSLFFFLVYYFSIILICSKEKILIGVDEIIIEKYLFCICYYKRRIEIKKIKKIKYQVFLTKKHHILYPLNFNGYSNILIQVETEKEEDKEYFFGNFLSKKNFLEIKDVISNSQQNTGILFLS